MKVKELINELQLSGYPDKEVKFSITNNAEKRGWMANSDKTLIYLMPDCVEIRSEL